MKDWSVGVLEYWSVRVPSIVTLTIPLLQPSIALSLHNPLS